MKEEIILSINPTYLCNLRCNFCYLSKEQLSSPKVISEQLLFEKLSLISTVRIIKHIDLYGGEIALINSEKLNRLLETIQFFFQGKINVITNLTVMNPRLLRDDIELSVSWDYSAREQYEHVYQNMLKLTSDFHILILASEKLLNLSDAELDKMIGLLNALPHLKTVEIKPFSDNAFHRQNVSFLDFEAWIKKWLQRKKDFRFEFINENRIKDSITKKYSAWSDEHLYITPTGDYAVLDFNEKNQEYFLPLTSFSDYEEWSVREKQKVSSNSYCGNCRYLGHCLSEHLQPVLNSGNSCNGFKNLLDWYQQESLG